MYCRDLNLPQPQFAKVVFVKPTIPKNLIHFLQIAIICQISGEHFGSLIDLLSVDLSTPPIRSSRCKENKFHPMKIIKTNHYAVTSPHPGDVAVYNNTRNIRVKFLEVLFVRLRGYYVSYCLFVRYFTVLIPHFVDLQVGNVDGSRLTFYPFFLYSLKHTRCIRNTQTQAAVCAASRTLLSPASPSATERSLPSLRLSFMDNPLLPCI